MRIRFSARTIHLEDYRALERENSPELAVGHVAHGEAVALDGRHLVPLEAASRPRAHVLAPGPQRVAQLHQLHRLPAERLHLFHGEKIEIQQQFAKARKHNIIRIAEVGSGSGLFALGDGETGYKFI